MHEVRIVKLRFENGKIVNIDELIQQAQWGIRDRSGACGATVIAWIDKADKICTGGDQKCHLLWGSVCVGIRQGLDGKCFYRIHSTQGTVREAIPYNDMAGTFNVVPS
jgi:hypothetical protein